MSLPGEQPEPGGDVRLQQRHVFARVEAPLLLNIADPKFQIHQQQECDLKQSTFSETAETLPIVEYQELHILIAEQGLESGKWLVKKRRRVKTQVGLGGDGGERLCAEGGRE